MPMEFLDSDRFHLLEEIKGIIKNFFSECQALSCVFSKKFSYYFKVYPEISSGASSRIFLRCWLGTSPEIPLEIFFVLPTGVPFGISQGVLLEISPRGFPDFFLRDFLDIFPSFYRSYCCDFY